MTQHLTRRDVLKRAGAVAAAAAVGHVFPCPAVLADRAPSAKLNVALVGCGGRGRSYFVHYQDMAGVSAGGQTRVVALADPDQGSLALALRAVTEQAEKSRRGDIQPSEIKTFSDYRVLYDRFHKQIDLVLITTPDHQHACAAMMAIKLGKHVYCEKPAVHHIAEARALGAAARSAKVATQMGNQGSGTGSHQALAEYLGAGAIGRLREVHGWHGFYNRFGGKLPKPPAQAVPKGLDWDAWLGPAKRRPFSSVYRPWHGWCDFGTGSLGGWGTHVMDAIFFALKLGHPTKVELVEVDDPSEDRFPLRSTVRYDFSAREGLAPISVLWYEGCKPHPDPSAKGKDGKPATIAHFPPLAADFEKQYAYKLPNAGSIFVGEKGMIFCASHGGGPMIFPESRRKEFSPPPRKLPRPTGAITGDFLRACQAGGGPTFSGFASFAGPFLESLLVGHLAMRAGLHKPVEWDGAALECTNMPELNRFVKREYRGGWSL